MAVTMQTDSVLVDVGSGSDDCAVVARESAQTRVTRICACSWLLWCARDYRGENSCVKCMLQFAHLRDRLPKSFSPRENFCGRNASTGHPFTYNGVRLCQKRWWSRPASLKPRCTPVNCKHPHRSDSQGIAWAATPSSCIITHDSCLHRAAAAERQ